MSWHSFQTKIDAMLKQAGLLPKGDSLLEYRLWLKLATECADLYDDLDHNRASLPPDQQVLIDYVCNRLLGILERSDVEVIQGDEKYDRRRHIPLNQGTVMRDQIISVHSPGFAVGRRVLRRARVTRVHSTAPERDTGEEMKT